MNAREQATQAMKRAWTIRKAAAVECGCKVSEVVFSLCLVQAWREIKMANQKSLEEQILEHAAVANFKEFVKPNINRVYLTLTGYSARFNGDRNTKVYFDRKSQKIMCEMGKGICSSEFNASLTALETFGVSRVN